MSRNIITALDVGTSTVQTVVAEKRRGEEILKILGMGVAASQGIRRGAVIDIEDATLSIRRSIEEARRSSGIPVRSVWLALGGAHVSVSSSRGVVAVSMADGEISPEDVRRAISAAESFIPKNPNKEIIHMIPRDFRVDNEVGIKDPVGMHGVRLEVDTLIIECSTPFLKNIFKCANLAGLKVEDYVFAPYAAAEAVLTKRQKELGVMLLDIGGGTASFIVFEEGVPIHAGVIPIGGNHITNDIAIGFRTHVDIAEQVKLAHGLCLPGEANKREAIRLADFIEGDEGSYSKKELAEITAARLKDIFELVQKELKKISRTELLPAGVVLVGGASITPGLVELAKEELRLPVSLGTPQFFDVDEKNAPSFATVFGVLQWVGSKTSTAGISVFAGRGSPMFQSRWFKWLKSFLP